MAHKALIGGTAYEISGGKTLIGGTAYEIDKGKTLVGGTAYEVGFGPKFATVTIIGLSPTNSEKFGVTIDGQTYNADCGTVEIVVPKGTLVECSVLPTSQLPAKIKTGTTSDAYGMGTTVAEAAKGSSTPATYNHKIVGDTSIEMFAVAFIGVFITINEI